MQVNFQCVSDFMDNEAGKVMIVGGKEEGMVGFPSLVGSNYNMFLSLCHIRFSFLCPPPQRPLRTQR